MASLDLGQLARMEADYYLLTDNRLQIPSMAAGEIQQLQSSHSTIK